MRYLPLLLLLITFPAPAKTVHHGKVVKIADGDTLTLLVAPSSYESAYPTSTRQNENSHSVQRRNKHYPT
jgi:endonuclease YncB( thermonuclease family)